MCVCVCVCVLEMISELFLVSNCAVSMITITRNDVLLDYDLKVLGVRGQPAGSSLYVLLNNRRVYLVPLCARDLAAQDGI